MPHLGQVPKAQEGEEAGVIDDDFGYQNRAPSHPRGDMFGGRYGNGGRGRGRGFQPDNAYRGGDVRRHQRDAYDDDDFGGQPDPYQRGRERDHNNNNLNSVKLNLPMFKGSHDPEAYIEWKLQMERIFDTNISPRR